MVLIKPHQFQTAYSHILSSSRSSNQATTFILVSPDVDAICAAHLLNNMLRHDEVMNTVIPVGSWPEMRALRERFEGEDIRTLIFINLGGLVDLLYYFEYLPPTCMMHVIDSHRPTNLSNLYTPSHYAEAVFHPSRNGRRGGAEGRDMLPEEELSVVVWGDEEGDEETQALEREAHLALLYEPEPDSDDSDASSSDEDEDEEDEDEPRRRRRRSRSEGSDIDEDEDGSGENGVSRRGGRSKRQRSDEPKPLTKVQKRRYQVRTDKYYTSTFTGQSVASQVFVLVETLRRAKQDAVWLAILGLTSQFSTSLIDLSRYSDYVHLLADQVASHGSAAEGPRPIEPSEEMRLCLYRHSCLHDAMRHSGYVGSKMKLWKERGLKNLDGMLAKMGYSILQSRELFSHMDSDLKSSLLTNLKPQALEYGLDEFTYPSFVRRDGHKTDLSASDVVEGVSALLEVATGVRLDFGNTGWGGEGVREEWKSGIKKWVERGGEREEIAGDDEEDEEETRERKMMEVRTKNFWLAWDALTSDTALLRLSLPLAMALHRSVAEQGTYILDKGAITSFRTYRLATIKEGPYLDIFQHPATLLRLANWLVDAVRDLLSSGGGGGIKGKSLPFVLASLNQKTDRFLVVGIIGAVEYGDVKKNLFGQAFESAAVKSKAQTRQTSFESSVIEVKKDDLPKFLKLLAIG